MKGQTLSYTLLTDGPSDRVLLYPIDWLLQQQWSRVSEGQWADLGFLNPVPTGLTRRIQAALELYPSDILLVHRDAEREPLDTRRREIERAVAEVRNLGAESPFVCLIPVRMTEAWFLFDESAIRQAASNPNGRAKLLLPRLRDVESLSAPKDLLNELLVNASELKGRRRKKFDFGAAYQRLAELTQDYSPLRQLPAFQSFEVALSELVGNLR